MIKIDFLAKPGKLNLDNKKIAAVIIFSLLIAYLDYSLILKLQLKSAAAKRAKIEKLKSDITLINQGLANMERLAARGEKEPPKIKEAITEDKLTLLLQDISDVANANDVKIIQIRPLSQDKDTKGKTKTTLAAELSPVSIILDLSCDYNALNNFIGALENYKALITVQGIKISVNTADSSQRNVNLILMAYVKK